MKRTDFEKRYQEDADPWGYRDTWYEKRKYQMTLACLPREHYRLAWEPACSIGVLTRMLAARADRVIASDVSPTAVAAAQSEDSGEAPGNVAWSVRRLPEDTPPTGADLVVLSEILYYLDPGERERVMVQAWDALEHGGDLIIVHWRSSSHDTYLSGEQTHAWACAQPGWRHLISHQDEEFVLDVLRRS